MTVEPQPFRFTLATYPIRFGFKSIAPADFGVVQETVGQEYDKAGEWKRLKCRGVRKIEGLLFALEMDHVVEFDWSCEGAEAFRPINMDAIGLQESWVNDSSLWSGQIVELNDAKGLLYVLVDHERDAPQEGTFLVRPFEFLRHLNNIYNGEAFLPILPRLKGRLNAALGKVESSDPPEYPWRIIWGPPGTGKTYTTAHQIADVLDSEPWIDVNDLSEDRQPNERILVVSTTNRAVDAVAVAIGKAVKDKENTRRFLDDARLVRIGKGAQYSTFEKENLLDMLHGTDTGLLAQIESLRKVLAKETDAERRAIGQLEIKKVEREIREAKRRNFLDAKNSVVVCTAYAALGMLADEEIREYLGQGKTPFTTIYIDEAGLISRATCAALSLLASQRVVLVGDSKQLSPISKISRILPPNKKKWVASSGLSHLETTPAPPQDNSPPVEGGHFAQQNGGVVASPNHPCPSKGGELLNVQFLNTQYRMHPEIGNVISQYLYDGKLLHAEGRESRPFALQGDLLAPHPRAIWCVLDAEVPELPTIRYERGTGNRSWVRNATVKILDKLFSDAAFARTSGLFISPFAAQAKKIQQYLATANLLDTWSASTVHSQQGQEADIVIFDTVNAGSNGWMPEEWNRMVNVGLSRAKEMVILLASCDEMYQGYLSPLLATLKPRTISVRNGRLAWREVDEIFSARAGGVIPTTLSLPTGTLGHQIAERTALLPILSQEQQQLCGYKIDGKPRLVRGVAGSGKTAVLAEWLVRCLNDRVNKPEYRLNDSPYWIVFGNRSLESLLTRTIENAWRKQNGNRPFPYEDVKFLPIWQVLEDLAKEFKLPPKKKPEEYNYCYDERSQEIIDAIGNRKIEARCDALFIDEAQDMGQNTLKLLFSLVHASEGGRETDKSIFIFYDNAQNVYKSGTPKWSELGLDMRGRSTIMKESFRSTRIISEYAINVLYHLKPDELGEDHKELVEQGLLVRREKTRWWEVRFNQIGGPKPVFKEYFSQADFKSPDYYEVEFTALGRELNRLLTVEHVSPMDICILCNKKERVEPALKKFVIPQLPRRFDLCLFPTDVKQRNESAILVETPHSFKGFDAEIVFIPAVDTFVAKGGEILANPLYVAMTRARGVLNISATTKGEHRICEALHWGLRNLTEPQTI